MATNNKPKHGCLVRWRNRLDGAIKRGHFTLNDVAMAANWNMCAVGEAHNVIPDLVDYSTDLISIPAPIDNDLFDLGVEFADAVAELGVTEEWDCSSEQYVTVKPKCKASEFRPVAKILDKIESRLKELYDDNNY